MQNHKHLYNKTEKLILYRIRVRYTILQVFLLNLNLFSKHLKSYTDCEGNVSS